MIPLAEDMMQLVLEVCKDGKKRSRKEIASIIADKLELSKEERAVSTPSGNDYLYRNRTGWALQYLRWAKFVKLQDKKNVITDDGKMALSKTSFPTIKQIWDRKEQRGSNGNNRPTPDITKLHKKSDPEELVKLAYEIIRNRVEGELLNNVKSQSPEFFEKLVVKLIRAMGYGIESENTGRSRDGGIDGIIKSDKLGLDDIYLQAKRQNAKVSVDQIKSFYATITRKKSKKGIFVTTSDFSDDASRFIKQGDTNIVLINGDQLARHMYNYNIGVNEITSYDIKEIMDGFFTE